MTSKDWQLQDALGCLRILSNQVGTDKIQSNFIVDALHASLSEVAQYLSVAKIFDYGIKTTLSATGTDPYKVASLAGFTTNPVNQIVKIVDSAQAVGSRLCIELSQDKFDNIKNIYQNTTNSIFWTRNGDDIYFYSGNLSLSATLIFFYIGYPKKITTITDYLEIKDSFMSLVIAKAKLKIYEAINQTPPDSINQSVNNQMMSLRNSSLDQLTNKRKAR